ncbi:hypothetical protein [Polaribacter sp. SA4-12]|uniref:hypothetical protein n=1 Tax=Polaribacter sp. SA4-12 TaxID=1312072 RepID=UPI000B3C39D0|nr:hypothetical protein [Polaribacter sp. SA4-12]ARV14152.1 hypothetical protein BTO07_02845 [Polaribacter sp. SA4-12]
MEEEEKKIINSKHDFYQCIKDSIIDPYIEDYIFNYYFEYGKIVFEDLIGHRIPLTNNIIYFTNCEFSKGFQFRNTSHKDEEKFIKLDITFENCTFYGVSFIEKIIDIKVSFFNCKFKEVKSSLPSSGEITNNFNFHNITFNKLISFWNSDFYIPVAFFQTNFVGNVTFSAATFYENVLFPYASFNSKIIFSRVTFLKGLDLSLALNSGEYNFFSISLKNFNSSFNEIESQYNNSLNKGDIPIINKIETFRIIKSQLEKSGNNIDAFKYNILEKISYQQQLEVQNKKWYNNEDSFMFTLNNLSNEHKKSWLIGVCFTLKIAFLFILLTLLSTKEFWNRLCFKCEFDLNVIGYTLKQFVNFLNPLHSIDYIDGLYPFYGIPYIFDYLGRIFVGYGIYQTIQAFRKFR